MIQAATFPPPLFGVVFGLAVSRICKKNKQTALVTPAGSEYTIITMCTPVFYRFQFVTNDNFFLLLQKFSPSISHQSCWQTQYYPKGNGNYLHETI